jgi:hypothetical protein
VQIGEAGRQFGSGRHLLYLQPRAQMGKVRP